MKKWLIPLLVAAVCLAVCGCESGALLQKEIGAEELRLTFDVPAEIHVGEAVYACQISHDITQRTQITLTDDGALQGLQYQQSGDGTALSYQSLIYGVRKAGFPKESSFPVIADVLDYAQSYVNLTAAGNNTFTGSINGNAFQVTADSQGTITAISTEDLQVVFQPQAG